MDLLGQLRNRRDGLQKGVTDIRNEITRLQYDHEKTLRALEECEYWLRLEEERCARLPPEETTRPGDDRPLSEVVAMPMKKKEREHAG